MLCTDTDHVNTLSTIKKENKKKMELFCENVQRP